MDNKQKIAQIDSSSRNITIRYQLSNHLGSAALELDENAEIISYEEYYPFGSTSYKSGRSESEVSQKRYKYVMKELDNETGLYYYGMRYYAPWIARFISVDPLQHKYPIYTPYQYAGNMPITYTDLDGAEPDKTTDTNLLQRLTGDFQFKSLLSEDSNYVEGFGAGIGDWLLNTSSSLLDMAEKGMYYNPISAPHMMVKDCIFEGNPIARYKKDVEALDLIAELISDKEQLTMLVNEIQDSLGEWWDDISFNSTTTETGYEQAKVVLDIVSMFFGVGEVKALLKGGKLSVWALNQMKRGLFIEKMLGGNLPKNYPVIDKFKKGVATSIKSLDLTEKSYQNMPTFKSTLKRYVNKLSNFEGANWGGVKIQKKQIKSKQLDIAFQKSKITNDQLKIVEDIKKYAKGKNIQVNIHYIN